MRQSPDGASVRDIIGGLDAEIEAVRSPLRSKNGVGQISLNGLTNFRMQKRSPKNCRLRSNCGRTLIRQSIDASEFDQELPFRWRAAEELKCIGEYNRTDIFVRYSAQMPTDWKAIYLLTTLNDNDLRRFADEGKINSEMNQTKVRGFKRLLRREREAVEIANIDPEYCIHHCAIEDVDGALVSDGCKRPN